MDKEKDYEFLRNEMVREQLIARGIVAPRVLDAFKKVPRHRFVSKSYLRSAYDDHPLPIGEGQTISQPYMVALMTECLRLKGNEKILEIGTGSGYQTAILAQLSSWVYSVERFASLAKGAQDTLAELGYKNVSIKTGDGTAGWEENSPYDGIIVTAGSPSVPKPLLSQLKEGGRLIIPIGGGFSQTLTIIEKIKNEIKTTQVCDCVFVPLVGEWGWEN